MKYLAAFYLMGDNRWFLPRNPDTLKEVRYISLGEDGEISDYMTAWRMALAEARFMALNPFRSFHHVGKVEIYALGSVEEDISLLKPQQATPANR